ncbi:MAG TPA: glycosyltransferase WbuB [Desulfobacterales bacterium]|nr:glycosyltransferase WbuB [Desulfobacterales bacterium]
MNILLTTPFFPPEVGSASHLFYELAQALQNRGHTVTVLTGLPRYHVADNGLEYRQQRLVREVYHGLDVWRVWNLDIPWDAPVLRGLDQFVFAASAGLAGLRLPDFDAALVYSPPLPLALAALGFCRARRRPLVVNVQDLFPQSAIDLGVLTNPMLIRIFRHLEARLFRRAELLTAHSEGNRQYILTHGGRPGRVRVLPNWIDTSAITPGERHNGWRATLGWQDRFIVSFAGIMGYSQDLETILECARLLQDRPDIGILMVGDGVEKPKLLHMAKEMALANVAFLPMQPKEKYSEVLAASDVCLATLRPEVQTPVVPSKILSIMAAGRPVLAAMPLGGDGPKLVTEAGCGLCVEPGNPPALSGAILRLYTDPELRTSMGHQGRHYAEAHLSLEACVGKVEDLLSEARLLAGGRRGI